MGLFTALPQHSRIVRICLATFLLFQSCLLATDTRDLNRSTVELERRLNAIDSILQDLSDYQIVSGMGPIGYRSDSDKATDTGEWVEVALKEPTMIDQIVLVPALWRGSSGGPQADAFPEAFRAIIRDEAGEEIEVARFGPKDQLLPRIAPVTINVAPQLATHVRIEAIQLTKRAWDKVQCLQLSELLVFNGINNVALHQEVSASSSSDMNSRHRQHLVDGFVPYLMGVKNHEQSTAFLASYDQSTLPEIIIDLGESYPVEQVNLHALETADTIPQTVSSGYAFPRAFTVEGSNHADFSDSTQLFQRQVYTVFDIGPVLSERFAQTNCRYIRLRVTESYIDPISPESAPMLGFAEIEVFTNDTNVALNKQISSNTKPQSLGRTLEALTDGQNFFGAIIPMRDWLGQLSLRHDLERERPLIQQALKRHYARQKTILNQLVWLVVVLIIVAIFISVLIRLNAQRSIQRIRERIAADLHDELGANLHAIGLLSDLSKKAKDHPAKLSKLLERIRKLTERTGAAARHCTNMLEAEELYSDISEHIWRVSRRLLNDYHHDLSIEGKEHISKLSPRRRIDLCLFYQECLTNILRHSKASHVTTELTANKHRIKLTIIDNGIGLGNDQPYKTPKSVSRRSRLLGSKLIVGRPEDGGTQITLELKIKRFLIT